MRIPKLNSDYLKGRATSIETMPFRSRRFYNEILEIEAQLDEIVPGWCEPLRRTGSAQGLRGLMDFQAGSPEELGEAKRLLMLRKLRWAGKDDDVVVSYCSKTGKPVAIPVGKRF